jgi:ABC-2 type transport system ATP-binding protein
MTAESGILVSGRGLTKVFKDFWGRNKVAALTDVDIEVSRGAIFGLLGPNGAGKSTLIKLILGHLYPTQGRLTVLGKSPRDVGTKSRIGYQPERSHLYSSLTAEETLHYFGSLQGLSRDQVASRSEQLLEMVGLKGGRKRLVGEFSHGMNRRLGLAQALLNDPDLLILDEPTAGLDPVGCREVKDLIITLGQRGKTVLLTSHLLADVEDVCDEVMLLYGGRVESRGSIDQLLANSERVRLEFPAVDAPAMSAIREAVAAHADAAQIEVSAPTETLENYFLRAVARRSEKATTAGAQVGTGVAGFLRDPDSPVDTTALAGLAARTAEVEAPPADTAAAVDTSTLDQLSAEAAETDAATKDTGVDRQALDDLTQ